MRKFIIFILPLFLLISLNAYPIKIDKNAGIVLKNRVNLRAKPSVKSKVIGKLNKGDMLIVLGKTKKRYDEKRFKEGRSGYYWYKVKTRKRKVGWLFGKYCGINIDSKFYKRNNSFKQFSSTLKKVNNTKKDIDNNGKKEIIWFAFTEKSTWLDLEDDPATVNIELSASLVITKSKSQSFVSGALFFDGHEPPVSILKRMTFKELTGDRNLEIIFETDNLYGSADQFPGKEIKIISLIKNKLVLVFNINIYSDVRPMDADIYYKPTLLSKKKIVVNEFHLFERIIYKSNFIYQWNKKKQQFIKVSEKKRLPIYAKSSVDNLRVRIMPNRKADILTSLKKNQIVKILTGEESNIYPDKDIIEKYPSETGLVTIKGKKGYWFPIKLKNGTVGWIFSYYLKFEDDILQALFMSGKLDDDEDRYQPQLVEFK